LRHEYKDAVASYDASLKLVPGLPEDAGDGIGRDAAYNRAIALRRIEENERDAGPPDASPDAPPDAEPPEDGADSAPPDGGDQDQGEDGGTDGGNGQQSPDAGAKPDAGADGGGAPPEKNQDREEQGPKEQPPVNQDERLLDQLENAPTLQEHAAKRSAKGRATMEDK
jgi:hypothetical protein